MTTYKTGSPGHKYFHFSMPPTHQCSVPHHRVISTRETWFLVTSHAQAGRICGVNQPGCTLPCSRCLPGYLFHGRTQCIASPPRLMPIVDHILLEFCFSLYLMS